MPIYEYVCESCGAQCEILRKISEPDPSQCPSCGAASLKKKISAAGFRLQGSGWYETDFKTDNRRNLAGEKDRSKDAKDKANGKSDKNVQSDKATPSSKGDATKDGVKAAKQAAASSPTVSKPSHSSSGSSKTTGATD